METVSAEPGDEIEFQIKINSTGNTAAQNVKVRDYLPYKLNYVNGSTSGATTSSIVDNWVNIGSISNGSSKTVYFRAEVADENSFSNGTTTLTNTAKTYADDVNTITDSANVNVNKNEEPDLNPSLSISKLGRNLTNGGSSWVETVSAEPGDEIEFQIRVNSNGDETAHNVRVRDYLPYKLNYVSGSTYGATTGNITDGWLNIGSIADGSSKIIYFRARVANEDYFSTETTILTNTAKAYADDIDTITDNARVEVEKEEIIINTKAMSISKLGRNISTGQTGFSDYVPASPGDVVEFSIQVANTGNTTLNNVKVWDTLPSKITYTDDTCLLDGSKVGDGVAQAGLLVGNLSIGQNKTIRFQAQIASSASFEFGSASLTNYGYANATNLPTISDSAIVTVGRGQVLGVQTGPVDALVTISVISFIIAAAIYLIIKKEKEITTVLRNLGVDERKISRFYAGLKLRFCITKLRFKERYI